MSMRSSTLAQAGASAMAGGGSHKKGKKDKHGKKHKSTRRISVAEPVEANVRVLVEVSGQVFDIAVGDAEQNVRWLALVAQRRLLAQRSHGSSNPSGRFLRLRKPVSIKVGKDEVPPSMPITRAFELMEKADADAEPETDGRPMTSLTQLSSVMKPKADRVVHVVLQGDRVDRDPRGMVESTIWEAEAFSHSENALKRLKRRKKEAQMEEDRKRRIQEAEEARIADERAKRIADMFLVDYNDPTAIEALIAKDWKGIRLDEVSRGSSEEQVAIKRVLFENFLDLNDTFKYFSGGGAGATDDMSLQEFQQFCMTMPFGMINLSRDSGTVVQIFRASNAGRMSTDDRAQGLTRMEFVEALLRIAVWRYGPRDGVQTRNRCNNVVDALSRLLELHIKPGQKNLGIGELREAMALPRVKTTFINSFSQLRAVFDFYRQMDATGVGGSSDAALFTADSADKTISFNEFVKVIADSGLAKSDDGKKLSVRDLRRVFAGSQEDESSGAAKPTASGGGTAETETEDDDSESSEDDEDGEDDSTTLNMREFIEAIARVALKKYRDRAEFATPDKVARAVRAVAALDKDVVRRSKNVQGAVAFMRKLAEKKRRELAKTGPPAAADSPSAGGAAAGAGAAAPDEPGSPKT